jgi:hypothetical protein
MLKSQKTADSYKNVYLSNLKLISTTRHCAITDKRLWTIDSVLRDIEAEQVPEEGVLCEDKPTETSVDSPEPEPTVPDAPRETYPTVPILMSVQYQNEESLTSAVEGFLRDYRDSNGGTLEKVVTCEHCASTEVQHSGQIAEISHWRTSLMTKLNLRTRSFV